MDPITIAMGLASVAPQIIKWITGSDKAEQAATAVVDIAKKVTGTDDGSAALATITADPALALQFRQAVMNNATELDKLFLADMQDARRRDAGFQAAGKRNYRADVMFVLAVAVICALVWMIWKDASINEFMKGIVTLVLGRFLGYLDNIYNFEFGTSRGSQNKDATIAHLTK